MHPANLFAIAISVTGLGVELDRLVVLTKSRKYNTQVAIRLTLPGPSGPTHEKC